MAGTFTSLLFHIVFSTKNRLPLITPELETELHAYMGGIVANLHGKLIIANGMNDHTHLLVQLKPTILICDFIRDVKANASKWVNEEKWKLRKFGWQDGYAAFTVSKSQSAKVENYIRNQREHHQTEEFIPELKQLLQKHEIEFKDEYLD